MDSVRKIVNCTPEQYLTLLKEGQVEVNGEVKTKEDGTLYNPGELPLLEWYNKVMAEELRRHTLAHTPLTTKTLEQEYDDILASDERYVGVSAVGYRAILQNGDTVKVAGNSGRFFLNGERLTKDYTYDGEGCEMVSVWVFEGVGDNIVLPPTLNDASTFSPYEINIKNIGQTPTINEAYYLYASKITTYNFTFAVSPKGCAIFATNGTNSFSSILPLTVKEIYSDCELFNTRAFNDFGCSKHITKISLPECRTIRFYGTMIAELGLIDEWIFGKLETIEALNPTVGVFTKCKLIHIPNTVKTIKGVACYQCTDVRLECNRANYIDTIWCGSVAPTYFSMAKDWRASVNIAVAAKNWAKDRFVDLFTNYLADLSYKEGDTLIEAERELTIPQAIYDILTDEEFAIAENKGWIIGGA